MGERDKVSLTAATQAEGSADGGSLGDGDSLAAGDRIGNYAIRTLLGEGGMGRVYRADQLQPVQRPVALKLVREQMDTPLARAYFDVERQALAQMQHPAIAQVFDAGTEGDVAYIAMELVEGAPLTEFCVAEGLDREQRLRLFEQICNGVQHAHQKGVIHRDLKPDNVLVQRIDGQPAPKIIDFGIAIGEAESGSGEHRGRAGTVIYMSPEQASRDRRDLDTRSDVYSLGVMLFEVLTGDHAERLTSGAFQSVAGGGATWHETLHATLAAAADETHQESAPDELLAAARGLPTELRAILTRALQTDRNDRYESAAALAEDLQRFRERRPVLAMAQSKAYLARKFLSRHRIGIASASLVALALVAGIVLALHGQRRAEAAAEQARIEAEKADQVSDFVTEMLAGVDPDVAKGRDTTVLRQLLDDAAQRAGSELADQPAVRSEVEATIAGTYSALGQGEKAIKHELAAVAAARAAGLPILEIAELEATLAVFLAQYGSSPAQALALAEKASASVADVPWDNPDKLDVEYEHAVVEWSLGKLEQSKARVERVLAEWRKSRPETDDDVMDARGMLASTESNLGNYRRAIEIFAPLIADQRKKFGPMHAATLGNVNELAIAYLRLDDFAHGEKILREALPIATKLFGADNPSRMNIYSNLGGAIRQQGKNKEARPYYERSLEWALEKYGADSSWAVSSEANMAFLLRDIGELDAAEQHARRAVAHMNQALGSDNGYRGAFPDLLGTILTLQKRYTEAERAFIHAWKIYTASDSFGAEHPLALESAGHRADLYEAWGKPELAAKWRVLATPDSASGAGASR